MSGAKEIRDKIKSIQNTKKNNKSYGNGCC
jgi:hypothetical protein